MPKLIDLNQKEEVIFSLPKGRVLENKKIVLMLSNYINSEVTENDLIRAQVFSDRFNMEYLVCILNENGLSFLPNVIVDDLI